MKQVERFGEENPFPGEKNGATPCNTAHTRGGENRWKSGRFPDFAVLTIAA